MRLRRFTIAHANDRTELVCVIDEAARILSFTQNGADAVQPISMEAPKSTNAVLVPWPNRVRDGRWRLGGQLQQLELTEPARNNAIHGLLLGTRYTHVANGPSWVELEASIADHRGYPFMLDTRVRYELGDQGLRVSHTVTNMSTTPAPVGFGAHPYLAVGGTPMRRLALTLSHRTELTVDARLLPIGARPAAPALRRGVALADADFDTAFADPVLSAAGRIESRLAAPDSRNVVLWSDPSAPYLQVYTTDRFETVDGRIVAAVALEPMSMPADAFNSGDGLRWLDPGETAVFEWGIEPHLD